MFFIGNDLVAFSEMNCFERKGYKQKAFTVNEIRRAQQFKPDTYYGLLWSCKESAYKVLIKSGFRKSFAAGKYEVALDAEKKEDTYNGIVNYSGTILYAQSKIKNKEYIHTICSDSPEGLKTAMHETRQISFSDYNFQNSEAIRFLKEYLATNFRIKLSEIDIHYDHLKRYPVIFFNSGDKHLDISLSHDGYYVAFALLITDVTKDSKY